MRRAAKSIVLVSPTLLKDFKMFSEGKVKVIENGIALPENSSDGSTGEEIRLLCTGRADKQKGFQTAIRAVAERTICHYIWI